jgi:hypothetical protein
MSEIIEEPTLFIQQDGSKTWFVEFGLHRLDGPAIIETGGTLHWYVDGERHRLDGPAYTEPGGRQEWWVNDRRITSEVEAWIAQLSLPPWEQWTDTEKTLFKITFTFPNRPPAETSGR